VNGRASTGRRAAEAPVLMQDYLRAAAERRPDATAVTLGQQAITFGELEESSSRLARLLLDLGCGRGDRVCLLAPKSPAAVVAMHAAMKADCWYVPLDLESPPTRVGAMLSAAEPAAIVATETAVALLDATEPACPVVSLGEPLAGRSVRSHATLADAAAFPAEAPPRQNRPDDPSHILFTSGSTGVPKGVMVRHSSVIAFVEWARSAFGLAADDRVSGHSPFHFDLSTFDIYGALAAAAELHLAPPEANLLPSSLASFIAERRLTQWFSVPSAMTLMAKLDVVEAGAFPDLRRVLWCGEVLPTPILIHWMQRVPHATFTNLYGPTEATIASSYYNVKSVPKDPTDTIPIGCPCAGEELRVLDERLRPVGPGEIGHLYIGGVGLSPGYWRDEEKTRAAFVELREDGGTTRLYRTGDLARVSDGLVYFDGREDAQIKSRGHRIELGEIEAALGGLDLLAEYAVVGVESDGFEGTAICCAFVPRPPAAAEPAVIKRELRRFVPGYMLPSRWQRLDALPKNANGKVDRPKLRELFREASRG
jgi:amino acid adenylation domain-containing protein